MGETVPKGSSARDAASGDSSAKSYVAVSNEMRDLREAQTRLNSFLWSTEICYGHVLASPIDGDSDVWSLFSHAPTQTWFPNREGKLKYRKKVVGFQRDVRSNVRSLHSLVLVGYYGQFEAFLEERLGKKPGRSFVEFLAKDDRLNGAFRPLGETVMLADLSRLLRNRIAHAQPVPVKPGDDVIQRMCDSFEGEGLDRRAMTVALQSWRLDRPAIRACFDGFARSVDRRCRLHHSAQALALPDHDRGDLLSGRCDRWLRYRGHRLHRAGHPRRMGLECAAAGTALRCRLVRPDDRRLRLRAAG